MTLSWTKPMWQKLSLRARINLLIALVLALGLAINIARLVVEAGPRVQAEDQSVIRLAREFIEMIVADLDEAPDPDARLNRIASDLSRLRHVSITRQDGAAPDARKADRAGDNDDPRSPPSWFVTLVHPETTSVTVLFLITMMVVGRALAPLEALSQAIVRIEGGSYDVRVAPGGASELAAICAKLNHLAATLGEAMDDKRQLAERAVSLQDLERKEIARELHDEFGPYLFALRAHAGALVRLSDAPEPDADALRRHGGAILEQVNALQQFNRRVLEKLRPVGLAELGLRQALEALLRLWGESHPDVAIETRISRALGATGETADLTIYRVVQEALTNVFRHADATSVNVTIEPAEQLKGPQGARDCALVRVCDNGRGLKPGHRLGLGLIGMRERILALGGSLTVASGDGGVTVEALIPN